MPMRMDELNEVFQECVNEGFDAAMLPSFDDVQHASINAEMGPDLTTHEYNFIIQQFQYMPLR